MATEDLFLDVEITVTMTGPPGEVELACARMTEVHGAAWSAGEPQPATRGEAGDVVVVGELIRTVPVTTGPGR